jgi:Cu+-exporting ATPase
VLVAPGQGLKGIINDQQVAMGSLGYLRELGFDVDSSGAIALTVNQAETAAHDGPVTWWGIAGQVVGYFQLGDQIRPEALGVVQQLKLGGIQPVMLSGDRPDAVEYLADRLDQMPWQAQQSPHQKLSMVESLKSQGFVVGMVGDGMNDGPALAAAHVSFAMSEGTVLASEQADVTLAGGLHGIVDLVRLSGAVNRNIRQNLLFAFAYNLALIPIASGLFFPLTGWLLSPSFAGLAMALSSVSVVLNAARLNRSAVTA